jgi:hypothetical protein
MIPARQRLDANNAARCYFDLELKIGFLAAALNGILQLSSRRFFWNSIYSSASANCTRSAAISARKDCSLEAVCSGFLDFQAKTLN